MTRVLIPSPDDVALLAQLPAVVRLHNAGYAEALGLPADAPLDAIEAEAVADWTSRVLRQDPGLLMVLAVDADDQVTGAIVAQQAGLGVETQLITSMSLRTLNQMWAATVAWARACGARHILGMTPIGRPLCHHGEAFSRGIATTHIRDLLIREVAPCA